VRGVGPWGMYRTHLAHLTPMPMSRRILAWCTLSIAVACAPNGGPLPNDTPFMSGMVTGIGRVAEGWTVRVEERPQDVSGSAKGVFRVGERTDVRRAGRAVRAEELREGQRVRVWVTGPVMESYPVQAGARLIVIDTEAP
jgi:uncharacterized protein DUF3221